MDYATKLRLARHRDTTGTAIAVRLRAARKVAGFAKQTDFAKALSMKLTTYNSQEMAGSPGTEVMQFLYENSRIDFNFIIYGDFSQLPGDVQTALFAALDADAKPTGP